MTASKYRLLDVKTPYDDLIPSSDEPSVQFYIDAMRIYLGLYEGTLSMDEAVRAAEILKENPEFVKNPTNPTRIPLNETFKEKMLTNLQTLKKFNLLTKDSVMSAYRFALLSPTTPLSANDFQVLLLLEENPLCTLVDAAESLGVTPRTVARIIERLEKNLVFRVSALMDMTAFGAHSFMLFFTLADGIAWEIVEDGFALYPFTKNILKTSMTDLGYISFLVPGPRENLITFTEQVGDISSVLFEYSNLHTQEAIGTVSNLALFKDEKWVFSDAVKKEATDDTPPRPDQQIRLLRATGWRPGFTADDFKILAQYRTSLREPPRVLVDRLRTQGMDISSREVAQSIRKSQDHEIFQPFISLRGIGLSTSFCFEIVCDDSWRNRILRTIQHLPSVTYYLSQLGIIVWAQVPGDQQVEYYQIFRALEAETGIKSVNPIMTIDLRGSRSELDMIRDWKFGSNGWTVPTDMIHLVDYFDV